MLFSMSDRLDTDELVSWHGTQARTYYNQGDLSERIIQPSATGL
jgi:hypothetical protein